MFTSYSVDENTYKKCVSFSAQFQCNTHQLTHSVSPFPPPPKLLDELVKHFFHKFR